MAVCVRLVTEMLIGLFEKTVSGMVEKVYSFLVIQKDFLCHFSAQILQSILHDLGVLPFKDFFELCNP